MQYKTFKTVIHAAVFWEDIDYGSQSVFIQYVIVLGLSAADAYYSFAMACSAFMAGV